MSTYLGYEVKKTEYPDTPVTSRMLMQHIFACLQCLLHSCGGFSETCDEDAGTPAPLIGEKYPFQKQTVIFGTKAAESTIFTRLFTKYLVFMCFYKE